MQRGNLIVYDTTGRIFSQTGEADGEVLPHVYPVGIPWIEIPYGEIDYTKNYVSSIDVSVDPNLPIIEEIQIL